ncbi:segregation/condensation protein A [Candidatus Woesearchaeota archaeon]|nr:segregation/condensation protein A [Candidatus Woesearchaeota archaeon]
MDVAMLSNLNSHPQGSHEDRIFSILFQEDELTWQTIIHDLVKTEQMDPWDINIGTIADKFITMLRKMQEMDFRIGGKMILAAAILLKLKSDKLMKEDIVALDALINSTEDDYVSLLDDLQGFSGVFAKHEEKPKLIPRTPQPRQRKVSVYDLVEALEKALETETRKQFRSVNNAPEVKVPEKSTDMTALINTLLGTIKKRLSITRTITFDQLIPSPSKEDKVYTFIPLLHLDTQRKIELLQKQHFGTINIKLNKARLNSTDR